MEKFSPPIEDYLKTIYLLREREGAATTTAIAAALEVTPASVTGMIKKLAELKLVRHTPYQGVELTKSGEARPLSRCGTDPLRRKDRAGNREASPAAGTLLDGSAGLHVG